MEIDVRAIARLAKLDIPEDRIPQMEKDLSDILKMAESLPDLEDSVSLLDPTNTMDMRADEIVPSMPRAQLLQNAPRSAAGCFVVPKTVE